MVSKSLFLIQINRIQVIAKPGFLVKFSQGFDIYCRVV